MKRSIESLSSLLIELESICCGDTFHIAMVSANIDATFGDCVEHKKLSRRSLLLFLFLWLLLLHLHLLLPLFLLLLLCFFFSFVIVNKAWLAWNSFTDNGAPSQRLTNKPISHADFFLVLSLFYLFFFSCQCLCVFFVSFNGRVLNLHPRRGGKEPATDFFRCQQPKIVEKSFIAPLNRRLVCITGRKGFFEILRYSWRVVLLWLGDFQDFQRFFSRIYRFEILGISRFGTIQERTFPRFSKILERILRFLALLLHSSTNFEIFPRTDGLFGT